MSKIEKLRDLANKAKLSLQAKLDAVQQSLKHPDNVVDDCVSVVRTKWEQCVLVRTVTYQLNMTPCQRRAVHTVSAPTDMLPECDECKCHDMLLKIMSKLTSAGVPVQSASWSGEDQWYGSFRVIIDPVVHVFDEVEDNGLFGMLTEKLPERLRRLTSHSLTGHTIIKIFTSMSMDIDLVLWFTDKAQRHINACLVNNGNTSFWDANPPVPLPISLYAQNGRVFKSVDEVVDAIDPLREAFLKYKIPSIFC